MNKVESGPVEAFLRRHIIIFQTGGTDIEKDTLIIHLGDQVVGIFHQLTEVPLALP